MRQYKSYHTILKQLASKGKLPDFYRNQIDRTTLWRWKMEPDDKYTGKELSNIEVLQEFISRRETQKIMRTYLKVAFALSALSWRIEPYVSGKVRVETIRRI
jgi:putative transposase